MITTAEQLKDAYRSYHQYYNGGDDARLRLPKDLQDRLNSGGYITPADVTPEVLRGQMIETGREIDPRFTADADITAAMNEMINWLRERPTAGNLLRVMLIEK